MNMFVSTGNSIGSSKFGFNNFTARRESLGACPDAGKFRLDWPQSLSSLAQNFRESTMLGV